MTHACGRSLAFWRRVASEGMAPGLAGHAAADHARESHAETAHGGPGQYMGPTHVGVLDVYGRLFVERASPGSRGAASCEHAGADRGARAQGEPEGAFSIHDVPRPYGRVLRKRMVCIVPQIVVASMRTTPDAGSGRRRRVNGW